MTLTPALLSELVKLNPSAMIELFEIDATAQGGDLLRFHAGTNGLSQNIVWNGNAYVRYPIEITGFEFKGQGQFPRPTMRVSNILSAITQMVMAHGDLLGAKVTRRRTLAKFLDAVNFPGGTNATADPTAEFSEDIYFIDRKSSEDRDMVEFELAAALDLIGVSLPRRQVIQNICIWKYRGAECGFTGAPLFDINDQTINAAGQTSQAQAVVNDYIAVNQAQAALDLANAALSSAAQAQGAACDYQYSSRAYSVDHNFDTFTDGVFTKNGISTAYSGGVVVSLGGVYRLGAQVENWVDFDGASIEGCYIETWAVNSTTCSNATTSYNNALTDRNNKATALSTAQSNLSAALAALPAGDPIYSLDRCGKRLSSCKLRFGATAEIPFGSFPAAGLVK